VTNSATSLPGSWRSTDGKPPWALAVSLPYFGRDGHLRVDDIVELIAVYKKIAFMDPQVSVEAVVDTSFVRAGRRGSGLTAPHRDSSSP